MNEPLTITDEAREATESELDQHDDFGGKEEYPIGHFVQLAISAAVEKATKELREERDEWRRQYDLWQHKDYDCKILELDSVKQQLTSLRKVADGLADKYHEEMMMFFGHDSDCPCDRCTSYHAYTNFINQQKEGK